MSHRSSQIKKVVFNKVMSPPEQVEVLDRVSRCGNLKTAVFKNFTPWKVIYFRLIPVNLVKLDLAWSNVTSLNGIEFLSKLEDLEVAGNINLDTTTFQSLAGLQGGFFISSFEKHGFFLISTKILSFFIFKLTRFRSFHSPISHRKMFDQNDKNFTVFSICAPEKYATSQK